MQKIKKRLPSQLKLRIVSTVNKTFVPFPTVFLKIDQNFECSPNQESPDSQNQNSQNNLQDEIPNDLFGKFILLLF